MEANTIQRVAVIGLGTMGHGIAQSFATAGCHVTAYDELDSARESLHDRIRQNLTDFARAGLLSDNEIDPVLGRIDLCASETEAVANAEFVTEAIREDLGAKQTFFERIEGLVSDDTILASNSSTFPISQSGARLRRPERAVVTHWFNPPHIVPTVEVVGGPLTSEPTIITALELLRRAGKLAIRVNQELPGFLVNRVQIALAREVWDLYDRGVASVEDIDAAIRGSMGFRLAALGPFRIYDFGGLDIQTAVFRNLAPEVAAGVEVPAAVQQIVDDGHLGFKTGSGFYEYPANEAESIRSDRDQKYLTLLKLFHTRTEPHQI
jgi:3-hydroxybutyryl-CoA dehydrogenase